MIRFVDLTECYYWTYEDDPPLCAFLDTVTDRFLETGGDNVFSSIDDINNHPQSQRLRSLLPSGFFDVQKKECEIDENNQTRQEEICRQAGDDPK